MRGLVSKATTLNELRDEIVAEVLHRAWQERAVKGIRRTTKLERAEHEHTAVALEHLAAHLRLIQLNRAS